MKNLILSLSFILYATLISAQTIILDFEDSATSTTYQYFGSVLDPNVQEPIDNPDMSGINTSAKVMEHVKPDGAETWAGAFPNGLPIAVDLSTSIQICLDVWFNEPGNLAIKLENSSTGGPNWITTEEVTTTQTWVEVCYDIQAPSIEDPFQPAFGNIYDGLVVFFDFGTSPSGADRLYYFDNVVVGGMGASEGDISFAVDMNDYSEPFTTVYVSGTMNNWSGDANPLEDSDGDGIWTGTIADVPVGSQEFKFTLDNWAGQEQFTGGETCIIATDDGSGNIFVNRKLVVSGDATLNTYCFNSCYECGQGVRININVGTSHIVVDPEGIFIAGGGSFGNPGDNPMTDPDGDGVYSISLEREIGFSSHFTFTNGACPDWSCKENIAGLDCADPDNFNDRNLLLDPVMADMEINTCFAQCTDNTDCGGGGSPVDVTFQVDMNGYPDAINDVYLRGTLNGWSLDNPLTDVDGDGVWEAVLSLLPGFYDYKFNVNEDVWEEFPEDLSCTEDFGGFINRVVTVEEAMTVCYEWNSCESCFVGTNDLEVDETLFSVTPTLVNDYTLVDFNDEIAGEKTLRVFNATGILIEESTFDNATQYELETSNYTTGIYLIYVQSGNKIATKKIVKQ
ncbi:MAG: T9SS type A sorting domain-containing protein [Bacteroidetes bacterium]|jgi:hypothetical protein|nr:T9SS type A sorting domain-containing protein [Bacteroidota bacterium]